MVAMGYLVVAMVLLVVASVFWAVGQTLLSALATCLE